jgi:phospholipid N-methyltransferase
MNNIDFNNAQSNFDFFQTPEHHCQFIYDNCKTDKILNVLDVCCGLGSLSKLFYKNNHKITLIELNESFIPFLKSEYPKATIINKDFLSIDMIDKFDVIVCNPPFNTKSINKIYKLFFVKLLSMIHKNTKLFFICPNMFIRNQSKIKASYDFRNKPLSYNEFILENKFHPAFYYLEHYGFVQLDSLDFQFEYTGIKKMEGYKINNNIISEYDKNIFMINETYDIRFLRDIKDFKHTKTHCVLLQITF